MHLEFDDKGYVRCILYGCHTDGCSEYTGKVPTEPEAYADIDDWADRAYTRAYKLDDAGNLVYDSSKAITDAEPVINTSGSYSLEETRTPARWIDGRPIYKRTFECEINKLETYISAGVIDDLRYVTDITGVFWGTESNRWSNINSYYSDNYNRYVRVDEFNTVQCYCKGSVGVMFVTIYYTKLTD